MWNTENRIGIIGCGHIFEKHASVINQLNNCKLIAVADTDLLKAKKCAEKYNCHWYGDYIDMIRGERLDVVHICLPHYLHEKVAIMCLSNKLDVIIEKPMAITEKGAEMIWKASLKNNKRVMVIYQNRFIESTKLVKKIVKSKKYGNIVGAFADLKWNRNRAYYTSSLWRGKKRESGGGVLITQAIHTLDLLEYLIGDIVSVRGKCDNLHHDYVNEIEDVINVSLTFQNGVEGFLFATTCNACCVPARIELYFDEAMIVLTNNGFVIEDSETQEVVSGDNSGDICYGNGHYQQLSAFYNNYQESNRILSIEDSIHSVRVVNAIYKSCELGKQIDVKSR